ncbi:MAG: F0F1 ATP synthase subunit B [Deltaproteobacteria bacterium]|nr:F0F1 ATP synthase subunit B [Deltaproteobacteria bacterium]
MIVQTIVFLILGWITMKFIWPPLTAALAERQKKIADGLAAAEKGEKSLVEAQANVAELVRDARVQATKIVDQANRRANELVDEAKLSATAEGQRLVTAARAEVQLDQSRAREQLRKEVAALAVAGASKLLGREIDARAHADLLEKLAVEIETGR